MPFVIEVDGGLVGQVTVNNIVRGSAQFASIGYWIDQASPAAGSPTRGGAWPSTTASLVPGCTGSRWRSGRRTPRRCGSWRSSASRSTATPRGYLHIDGDWRDHRLFAVTVEEVPGGILKRLDG